MTCNQLSLRRKLSGPMSQWYGYPRVLGIPIPQTLVIWASPSHITLAIWVWVRVTGDTHITRFRGMGMPKTRGCPYHCDTGTKCSYSLRGGRKKGREWGRREKKSAPSNSPTFFDACFAVWSVIYSGNSIWRRAQGLAKNYLFAITRFLFIEVLFRTFLYYYWGKENCSLYRGLGYIDGFHSDVIKL